MFCSLFLFIMKIHPFMNPKLNEKFGEFQFGIKGKILNKKLKLISGKFSHWNLFGFLFVLNQYIYRTTMHGIKKNKSRIIFLLLLAKVEEVHPLFFTSWINCLQKSFLIENFLCESLPAPFFSVALCIYVNTSSEWVKI